MKHDFDTILDECIRRIEAGENLEACLDDYPEQAVELEALLSLAKNIYAISAPQGSAVAVKVGQERMLEKIDEVQATMLILPQLTFKERWLLVIAQISQTFSTILPKEKLMYRKSLIAIAFVLVVLFAGTTMTAYAAQGSLPGDPLYSLKTSFENMRLNATWDTTDEAERSIEYADRRIHEIAELISRSRYEDVPIGVDRFEYHLREALSALNIVAQNDPELARELAAVLVNLLSEQSQLLTAILEANPDIDQSALRDALTASLESIGTANSVSGLSDNINNNTNANEDNGNTNDDNGNANDDNGNTNDDNGNTNDDNGNTNDDNGNANDDNGNANDDNGNANETGMIFSTINIV